MFPASADNPGCLVLLALECEFFVYQIGTMRVDNTWSHQSESGKFLVAKGEYAHNRGTLLAGIKRSETGNFYEVHLGGIETGVLHLNYIIW